MDAPKTEPKSDTMIRAVLFDLGNTLVRYYRGDEFLPILRECVRCAAAAVHDKAPDLDSLFEKALELNHEADNFAVRPLEDRICKLFPACPVTDPIAMRNVCKSFMTPIFSCARVEDDAVEVLDALRARGLRTAIVSNTPWGSSAELWLEELHRHALLERLDAVTFCVEVGWRKPHPAPFLRTLKKLAIEPCDAVFVGDDPRWDVEGPLRAGIRPILVSDAPVERSRCTRIARLAFLLDPDVLSTNSD
jgi:putative hydrolase of the HAD superfamily